jgi:FMN-dependent NADH-azoreductase
MSSLLRIDAGSRFNGSHSRVLADAFEAAWSVRFPEGTIVGRDLATKPMKFLFGFLGLADVTMILAEATTSDPATVVSNIGRARTDIHNLAQAA